MEAVKLIIYYYELATTGCERPRVCFLPTASGDGDHYIVRFYRHFGAGRCEPSHVSLFRRDCGAPEPRAHLLEQDLVYVGGGCVRSMLGAWRAHGLDLALREAWAAGVVMCGLSAGSLCWFEQGLTAFHGEAGAPVAGLGLLPGSNAVHYDSEPRRRPDYHAAVRAGMPGGWAADDGAALHFAGPGLARVVASRPNAGAYRVQRVDGEAVETPVAVEYLGAAVSLVA
jgi:dipeptidase E